MKRTEIQDEVFQQWFSELLISFKNKNDSSYVTVRQLIILKPAFSAIFNMGIAAANVDKTPVNDPNQLEMDID